MGEPMECGGKSYEAVPGMPPEVRMVFSGFEVGLEVQSGAALTRCVPHIYCCTSHLICPGVRLRAAPADKHILTMEGKRWTGIAGTL